MPNISDMNIVLGQASAIKQMRAGAEQDVELNRQFMAQAAEVVNKKRQIRVKNIEAGYKTEIKPDDTKQPLVPPSPERVASSGGQKPMNTSGGTFVDIKV